MLFTGNAGLYAKALFATLMAVLTSIYVALDGENFNLSDKDWLTVAVAGLTALGVYLVPNALKSDNLPPKV